MSVEVSTRVPNSLDLSKRRDRIKYKEQEARTKLLTKYVKRAYKEYLEGYISHVDKFCKTHVNLTKYLSQATMPEDYEVWWTFPDGMRATTKYITIEDPEYPEYEELFRIDVSLYAMFTARQIRYDRHVIMFLCPRDPPL